MGLLNIRNYRNKVLNFIVDIIQYINVKERLFLTISKIMFSIVRMNIVDKNIDEYYKYYANEDNNNI